jgi:hypothetical protein
LRSVHMTFTSNRGKAASSISAIPVYRQFTRSRQQVKGRNLCL